MSNLHGLLNPLTVADSAGSYWKALKVQHAYSADPLNNIGKHLVTRLFGALVVVTLVKPTIYI